MIDLGNLIFAIVRIQNAHFHNPQQYLCVVPAYIQPPPVPTQQYLGTD